ncbi:unnamed protein product [Lactuca virosa]|uniref:Uncharacterized protein n=1 Tax=Lactuca virosa TaxID=75947 RepID=A0AAU9NDQ9_9ASTR|nr:unnamed protein product [Lactuca virosa]
MWTNKDSANSTPRGFPFSTPQPEKKRCYSSNMYSSPPFPIRQPPLPASEKKWAPPQSGNSNSLFHVIHKVPAGDSPYVRAKHVQLVDNNPSKAVSMFWAAINLGDRVDSALKDMAVVMKQLNRSDEAIEAIKSFRHLCALDAQESLDNILLELYKRSGRIDEQIGLLQSKLKHIEEATCMNGNRTKLARSQGKKIQITMGQEYSRLLGNLAWAHLQQDKYKLAEEIYRKALSLEPDKNKRCNLAICLMYMEKMTEAKFLLSTVKDSNRNRDFEEDSYAKSYERAIQVMEELEMEKRRNTGNQSSFSSFLSRHKDSDSNEKATTRGKRSNSVSDPGFRRAYASPSPICGTPRVPFTQPRRRDWERADSGGCFRKLHFEKDGEDKIEPGNVGGEMTEIPSKVEKKSWADMVEEDEQNQNLLDENTDYGDNENINEEEGEDYGDENTDCNVMNRRIESLSLQDGYQTQPGTAKSKKVDRCLTFGSMSQNRSEEENYWCSSSERKESLGYESLNGGNGGFPARNGFKDIVLTSERPRTLE